MINKDTNPKAQENQQLRHALNVNPLREIGGLPVEEGNAVFTGYTGTIVGSRVFNERTAILFTHVATGDDIIYRKQDNELITIFRGNLGFDKTVNVQCRIVPDSRGNLIAYFTDNKNPMKYINMDAPQQSASDMLYFTNYNTPLDVASVNVSESGGAIPAGVWFAFVALVDENETETNFITTKPIYITDGDVDFNKYDGADGGVLTNKSITLSIVNIDTRFKYVRIVFISRQAGVFQNGRQFDLRITSPIESFTFSGQETFVERTIENTVIPKVYYDRVKALAYNDNQLFLGNCTEGKDIGAQPYINNSVVTPVNSIVNLSSLENSHKDASTLYIKTGFFNDEVAALYAVFNLKNGTKSAAYHIPGRAAMTINGVNETMTWTQFQTANPSLYNTLNGDEHKSISNDGPIYTTLDTNLLETSYPINRCSFWQNATETYPVTEDWDVKDTGGNVIGTLRGTNVRHHKLPSNRSPFNSFYGERPFKSNNAFAVGFRVQLNLPQFIKDQVHSVEVYYARRDGVNQRIVAQGSFFYMLESSSILNEGFLYSPAIPPAIISDSPGLSTIRFSSFDTLFFRNNTSSLNYLKLDFVLKNSNNTTTAGSTLSEVRRHIDARQDNVTVETSLARLGIKKIERADYIPANVQVAIQGYSKPVVNNLQAEDSMIIKIQNKYSALDYSMLLGPTVVNTIPIINLYTYKTDVYKSFFQQELIFAGRSTVLESFNVFGGDCFLNHYSYRATTAPQTGNTTTIKATYSFPVQSNANVWFRQAGEGIAGMYFPRTPIDEFNARVNVSDFIKYNTDFSTLNNLEVPVPYDPDFIERDKHATRIHKTLPQGVERGTLRKLLPEDFVDLPTHRGELTGIANMNGNLIPVMEQGSFKTYGTQQLSTDADSIVVKSVDIFNVSPDEIMETDLGYGGSQSINSIISTPHGAFWVDRSAGKAFLAGDGFQEVSAFGLFNFFEKNLRSDLLNTIQNAGGTINSDMVANGVGVHSWYDQRYRRIFVTLLDYAFIDPTKYKGDDSGSLQLNLGDYVTKDGKIYQVVLADNPQPDDWVPLSNPALYGMPVEWSNQHFTSRRFTAAYYPERKGWIFYSYTPYHTISTDTEMLTAVDSNSNLWIHGIGFLRFYQTYHPMIVEMVLQHKQMTNIQSIAIDMQNLSGAPVAPTELAVYNTRQSSGVVPTSTDKNFGNIRFVSNYWIFNKIRDCVVDRELPLFSGEDAYGLQTITNVNTNKKSFTKAFLNDTFHVVRLKYQPIDQKDVTLFSIQSQDVKSNRL